MAESVKVSFHFFNEVLDEDYVESLWATVVDEKKGWYRLSNVPFFVTGYAFDDIVYAVEENDSLVVQALVEESGNSTIQLIFFEGADKNNIQQKLEALGCGWEGSHLPNYISIDVPVEVSYASVHHYLETVAGNGDADYREACLAHTL
ncbi:DUF4265 domain-containing protein [Hymenobacter lapidiphilus]|uniref:DUF4265 domain-containing protein n=1 Tax=Hymenobacter sp. CCM 8763 TaxID=2303334 RepID=UPI000E3417A0|nr:DUF4265 domain-containing protein [Hymenobacter sp. CCM 8763]RFP66668.1 DUF4265 domain-containing protein [Hymenobacter sp. CCM 8763]